jgi:chromosome segregation ATPase
VRTSQQQQRHTEEKIRAAIDRLLGGALPPGGKCDIKTLAAEAGVTRASLYTTHAHLKNEFEQRRDRLRDAGTILDPRQAQITRLKTEVASLRQQLADRDTTIAEAADFRTTAVSRLAAQHEEIQRLRAQIANHGNVRVLHRAPADSSPA